MALSPHHTPNALCVYLHVPFCRSHCIYCDFYVVLEKAGGQSAYMDAVLRELAMRWDTQLVQRPVTAWQTLYVGGGTPSLLPAADYRRLLSAMQALAPFAPDAERTIEANPGALADSPEAYLEAGFNRISVGIQSLQDDELKKLSRLHTASDAERFVNTLQRAGWSNISIDLMYAVPGQSLASWQATLKRAIDLGVQHVSMYGLKVEANTPLERLLESDRGRLAYPIPDEDLNVAMYFEALDRLSRAGFERYEFSNMAQPGFASRHNLNYWDNGEYLALGASAHGYVNGRRYETVRDLKQYLEDPLQGDSHPCPPAEELENAIVFGLRKTEGIDVRALERRYDFDFRKRYASVLTRYTPEFLIWEGSRLRLSDRAIPVSNSILAEFLH